MHVSLTPRLAQMVHEKVESGLYNNASEVIREALRLMAARDEQERVKLVLLREALAEGEADIAAGRVVELADEAAVDDFFRDL